MAIRFETPDEHPHVAVVTIDRPEKANALDLAMLRDLASALEHRALRGTHVAAQVAYVVARGELVKTLDRIEGQR